jgi:hypothetical protein
VLKELTEGNTLKQAAVLASCLEQNRKMGLDFFLAPEAKREAQTEVLEQANLNAFLFEVVHPAVQLCVEQIKQAGRSEKPLLRLNRVQAADQYPFTLDQLALIQYCHLRGYPCLDGDRKPLGEAVLKKYGLETNLASSFAAVFRLQTESPAKDDERVEQVCNSLIHR